MDKIIEKILIESQCNERRKFEHALIDLRFIIERCTMNRYGEEEVSDYFKLFYDKKLTDYRLKNEDLIFIKYFLFFILFNFPDRAVLIAKCIKLLFDKSIREAICSAIEIYMKIDDHATCELIFAITNVGDIQNYFANKRIRHLFIKISKFGGKYSREAVIQEMNIYKKEVDPNFTF